MMTNRYAESFEEALRKNISRDLFTDSRIMSDAALLRNVDEDALNKCRLSTYGQMRSLNQRLITRTGDEEDVQKARAKRGDYKAFAAEMPLEDDVERLYFEYYGENFSGGPVVDRPGAPYICPCGLKMMMVASALPEECPRCHRLTPVGKLIRDGVLRR